MKVLSQAVASLLAVAASGREFPNDYLFRQLDQTPAGPSSDLEAAEQMK